MHGQNAFSPSTSVFSITFQLYYLLQQQQIVVLLFWMSRKKWSYSIWVWDSSSHADCKVPQHPQSAAWCLHIRHIVSLSCTFTTYRWNWEFSHAPVIHTHINWAQGFIFLSFSRWHHVPSKVNCLYWVPNSGQKHHVLCNVTQSHCQKWNENNCLGLIKNISTSVTDLQCNLNI